MDALVQHGSSDALINSYPLFENNRDVVESVHSLAAEDKTRLIIDINHLDKLLPGKGLSRQFLQNPLRYLPAYDDVCVKLFDKAKTSLGLKPPDHPKLVPAPRFGIRGWLGTNTVTPRGLSSRLVNQFVCVVGIVTKCSLIHPKLVKSYYCADKSLTLVSRTHAEVLSSDSVEIPPPKTDNEGNPMRMEVGLSVYRPFQRATLQEMPETAPTGQLPRSVDVILEEDLVDEAKPGDRVRIWGVYRCMPHREGDGRLNGYTSGCLIATHVESSRGAAISPCTTPADIRQITELAERPDICDLLSRSIAPSLCGHDLVKKGLLLQLLGGERKCLKEGMHLRGDIHVLLVGDPSCGKSQLLRFMMSVAPLVLSTTGRGSSGVGLTAAVSSDSDTGERKLEAGAMVLGDGGMVCIDEFDKMSHEDRVAIHEVLEQQTVSVSKAGIQMTLNARTSVLAAANPVYGCFDTSLPLKSQVNFPDSLLTRFDLIYIIRDAQNDSDDRRIAAQVLQQLVLRATATANALDGTSPETGLVPLAMMEKSSSNGPSGEQTSQLWNYSVTTDERGEPTVEKVISTELLQKYIFLAKSRPPPVLTDEAISAIADFYADLRQQCAGIGGRSRTVIPTARTLEAAVRLSTAHAKLRLSTTVTSDDAKVASELLRFTLLGEPPEGFSLSGSRIPGFNKTTIEEPSNKTKRKRTRQEQQGVDPGSARNLKKRNARAVNSSSLVLTDKERNDRMDDDAMSVGSIESQDSVELSRKISKKR